MKKAFDLDKLVEKSKKKKLTAHEREFVQILYGKCSRIFIAARYLEEQLTKSSE